MGKSAREQHKILVVGLPPGSTSADLTKLVKPIGNPLSATMAVGADGRERGFGFVQFADEATQQRAIAALDKTALAGRTLNVRAVEERAPGSGGGASNQQRTAGQRGGRPCYEFARGRCSRGAACKWAHIAPPQGARGAAAADDAADDGATRSRRPEWQRKRTLVAGGEAGGVEAALDGIPDDICRKYQFGTCHRGEACRWRHVIWHSQHQQQQQPESAQLDGSATAPSSSHAKRPRRADGSVAEWSPSAAPGRAPIGIGWSAPASAASVVEALRGQLRVRESQWREAHPSHPSDAAIPEEATRRDVVWCALERKLGRALAEA